MLSGQKKAIFTIFWLSFLKATSSQFLLHFVHLPLYRLEYLLLQICKFCPLLCAVMEMNKFQNHAVVAEIIIL